MISIKMTGYLGMKMASISRKMVSILMQIMGKTTMCGKSPCKKNTQMIKERSIFACTEDWLKTKKAEKPIMNIAAIFGCIFMIHKRLMRNISCIGLIITDVT